MLFIRKMADNPKFGDLKMINLSTETKLTKKQEKLRAIAYSMDLLLPGFYFWCPYFSIRIGGAIPDDNPYKYPGKIHDSTGIALVLLGYRIFTTYQGSYDA
ncbi:hypothetical protein WA1_25720 [Scytonema hofmannii PCC 7110]|uniref:Uncharacterized protein n=2 Tax=Scytonema hofmannii TaxID=34078 RepID=A0A139X759_9CYAN|nr:hypothetical protein WA1_25720 [Scytonema hofmannii PCC 7110]